MIEDVVPLHAYLDRAAAVKAGISVSVPAMTLNRLCGSGVQDTSPIIERP